MEQLYTIGCSTLSLDDFVRNLKANDINVVADVRSVPYSRTIPQFNRESLKERLKKERIIYGDFSKEFGARRTEFDAYENNKISFEKTKNLPEFVKGSQRIQNDIYLKTALLSVLNNWRRKRLKNLDCKVIYFLMAQND